MADPTTTQNINRITNLQSEKILNNRITIRENIIKY